MPAQRDQQWCEYHHIFRRACVFTWFCFGMPKLVLWCRCGQAASFCVVRLHIHAGRCLHIHAGRCTAHKKLDARQALQHNCSPTPQDALRWRVGAQLSEHTLLTDVSPGWDTASSAMPAPSSSELRSVGGVGVLSLSVASP